MDGRPLLEVCIGIGEGREESLALAGEADEPIQAACASEQGKSRSVKPEQHDNYYELLSPPSPQIHLRTCLRSLNQYSAITTAVRKIAQLLFIDLGALNSPAMTPSYHLHTCVPRGSMYFLHGQSALIFGQPTHIRKTRWETLTRWSRNNQPLYIRALSIVGPLSPWKETPTPKEQR